MHPGTAAVMLYMVLCGKGTLFAMATVCILLHEAAHAVMAFILGEVPEEVEWLPLGALMRMEDEGRLSPLRRFAVLLAGPGMTLLLCSLSLALTRCGMLPKAIGRQLFIINAGFLLMNLLPCLPLDGGRMLALVLECFVKTAATARIMHILGTAAGCLCCAASVIMVWRFGTWNLSLAACGCLLIYAAWAGTETNALRQIRQLLARKILLEQKGHLPVLSIAVVTTTPLHRIVTALPARRCVQVLLVESGTLSLLGSCWETDVISAYLETPGESCRILLKKEKKGSNMG